MSLTILCYHFSKEKKNSFVYDDDDYRQTRLFYTTLPPKIEPVVYSGALSPSHAHASDLFLTWCS